MILRKPALVHRSLVALLAILFALVQQPAPRAEDTPQPLPFQQNWANTGLITGNDNWTGVAGIVGYLGDYTAASPTGVDPQTLLFDSSGMAEDVIANQLNPNTQITGGVAEFQITDPTIALQGSGTADAPFVLLNVDTTGATGIKVSYNVRDIDGSADNAVQQVALHYRVGNSGPFTNVPAGYIADATTGPSQATLITPVLVALPAAADNQPLVQIRIMTTNAVGSDEWVGVDDISVAGQTTEPSGVGAATPSIVSRGAQSLLTVTVTPGQNPQSTGLLVSADLSAIGGSASQQFFDDGVSAGDAVAGDLVFSFAATVAANTATVMHSLGAEISDDQGRSAAATIKLKVASNTVPQPLAFSQDWSDGGLIVTDADWSSVPGITGFRGDDPAGTEGVNPETIIGDTTHTAIDVIANQDDPNTSNKSGVAEFDAPAYRTVALRGSDSADAPFLLIALDTTGRSGVLVKYSLRDFNPAPTNAVQSFALQYRVGTSGDFFTVPAGFVANANNPSQAGGVTPVSAELPPDADNQPIVQVRIITANAVGDDEWIGVDDILIDAPQIDLSAVGQANPSIVGVGDTTVMRVTVTPGLNPTSTGIAVSADLSVIGGPADQPLAEGLAGVFSVSTLVAATTTPGMKHLPVSVTDAQGRTASFDIVLEVRATTPPSVLGSASPAQVFPGDSTLLTATVTPGAFPSSSGISVTADLTAIGGSGAQQLFDDGTHGD